LLLDHGFGFTDAVKRASARATDVTSKEFADGVADLVDKLRTLQPKIACFHGIMAYRGVHRVLTGTKDDPLLGPQPLHLNIGHTRLFLAPNPSPANVRIPIYPATHSDMKAATRSDFKPVSVPI